MDLLETQETYILIAVAAPINRLEIGRLGAYDVVPHSRYAIPNPTDLSNNHREAKFPFLKSV
jgi:hypothetical protein